MNIIVGATGQVGSIILREIGQMGEPVRAVVRNTQKVADRSIDFRKADMFDAKQLSEAFKGGTNVFVLTPENPASDDIIGDTERIVENYGIAIKAAGIKRIVGLSCIGAHVEGETGNILMSRLLEHGLAGMDVQKIFVRPSYYYSNWMGFFETVVQYGVLPTFFPADLKLDMHSPDDLAKFIAGIMVDKTISENRTVIELTGPQKYNSYDVANAFSNLLHKEVAVQPIPKEQWQKTLLSAGFTDNTALNLSKMTQAVIDGKVLPEHPKQAIRLTTDLDDYLKEKFPGS